MKPDNICNGFTEHPNWRAKHPTGPVTWDAWCSLCGFRLEDRQWASGLAIEGDGRRLGKVRRVVELPGETLKSDRIMVVCSTCCPQIMQ